jgi:hypothetical protein
MQGEFLLAALGRRLELGGVRRISLLSRSALIGQRGVLMIRSLDVIRWLGYGVQILCGGERRAA